MFSKILLGLCFLQKQYVNIFYIFGFYLVQIHDNYIHKISQFAMIPHLVYWNKLGTIRAVVPCRAVETCHQFYLYKENMFLNTYLKIYFPYIIVIIPSL